RRRSGRLSAVRSAHRRGPALPETGRLSDRGDRLAPGGTGPRADRALSGVRAGQNDPRRLRPSACPGGEEARLTKEVLSTQYRDALASHQARTGAPVPSSEMEY